MTETRHAPSAVEAMHNMGYDRFLHNGEDALVQSSALIFHARTGLGASAFIPRSLRLPPGLVDS